MVKNKCVIYARFSTEDELRDGKSRSISNQIEILTEYAKENDFELVGIYQDYMYTGRNFDRPGIQALIKAANNKEFDILLLKDLSRLGRNYIDVGTHIDNTFLANNIRIIAVNDNYDSNYDFDYLNLALKNYMNEYYSKEVSRKILRVILARSKYQYLGTTHYGYLINNGDATIYEPEAKIVRRIYKEFMEGISKLKIAEGLSKDKILKRSYSHYIKMKYDFNYDKKNPKYYAWDINDINAILCDEFYLGTAINFNSSDKRIKTVSEPIRLENHHNAIIKKEDFEYIHNNIFKHQNRKLEKENIRGMILCKKCLARYRYNESRSFITPTIIEGKEVYHDYRCRKSYPIELLNQRIYDVLLLKHKDILDHKLQYIEKIANEKFLDATNLKEIASLKKKQEKKMETLFESYVNGEVTQETFERKSKDINDIIEDCNNKLSNISLEEYQIKDIEEKVDLFLNNFKVDPEHMLEVINENVSKAIYDEEKGSIVIILKIETEIDIPSLRYHNMFPPEIGKRSEWDLDDVVYKIVCQHPHIKGREIYNEALKVWEGFTFKGTERAIRSLRLKNMIKLEGKASLVDGYIKIDYKEDFDYHNLDLNRKEKDVYRMLWFNPKLSIKELSDATTYTTDTLYKVIRKIRKQGGFEYPRFDKNYIPKGAFHSLYVDDNRTPAEFVKKIYRYIDTNPGITASDIIAKYNITEEQATTYLERRRKTIDATNN